MAKASNPDPASSGVANRWGYLALLRRNRAFRWLWLGKVISRAGDWFNTVALYEAVMQLSSSALAVTLVIAAKTLPIFVMTPIAGPLVDRVDRRVLLVATDLARALCGLSLIAAYSMGWLPGLYMGTVLMMMGAGIMLPASQAALPMIVEPNEIPLANALLGGTWSIMLAVGAALGGVATHLLGISAAFAIDVATFLLGAWFLTRLPPLPPLASRSADAAAPARFRDGVRYVVQKPYIACLVALKPMRQLYGGLLSLVPFYGAVVFSEANSSLFVGLLYAARGLGAIIGSLVLRVIFGDTISTLRKLILAMFVLAGLAYAALSLSTTFWHAALAYFVAAIGQSALWVFSGSLLQLEADRRFHGRVFAIESGLTMLALAASSLTIGAVLDMGVPIAHVVLGASALALLPISLWAITLWLLRSN